MVASSASPAAPGGISQLQGPSIAFCLLINVILPFYIRPLLLRNDDVAVWGKGGTLSLQIPLSPHRLPKDASFIAIYNTPLCCTCMQAPCFFQLHKKIPQKQPLCAKVALAAKYSKFAGIFRNFPNPILTPDIMAGKSRQIAEKSGNFINTQTVITL